MRDIRSDLRERLASEDELIERLQQQYEEVLARKDALLVMLEQEENRLQAMQELGYKPVTPACALDDFIVKTIKRGITDKEEIRDAAIRAGYFADSVQSPGRVVHAVLVNLVRDGRVVTNNEGSFADVEIIQPPEGRVARLAADMKSET
jgi:hypothetical protein